MREQEVSDRCQFVEDDFFAAVPGGGDVYLLKSVLHDWNDDQCRTILSNCRQAMGRRAALSSWSSCAGGRERSRAQLAALLADAGLRLDTVTPLPSGPHLLRATAA